MESRQIEVQTGRQHNCLKIPGYDVPEESEGQKAARRDALREKLRAEAHRLKIPEEECAEYLDAREKQEREWLRASQLTSPAPRGHFLREFGQSDRDFIDNANDEA
jgi:hypothetical protein